MDDLLWTLAVLGILWVWAESVSPTRKAMMAAYERDADPGDEDDGVEFDIEWTPDPDFLEPTCPRCGEPCEVRERDGAKWCRAGCDEAFYPTPEAA